MSRSLLLFDDETSATLHDALAFIDAFEVDVATGSSGDVDVLSTKPKQAPSTTKKARSHTERVKAELERLRADAEVLEATLKLMTQNSAGLSTRPMDSHTSRRLVATSRGDPRMAKWIELAVEEHHRRRESETLNRRLRGMLVKQLNMVRVSESALSSKFTATVRDLRSML